VRESQSRHGLTNLKVGNDKDKIVSFVMHGGGRNADDYLNAWVELANKKTLLSSA
jgi:hypothetical protein